MIVQNASYSLQVTDPASVNFTSPYYRQIYNTLYNRLDCNNPFPHIDFDDFKDCSIGIDIEALATAEGISFSRSEKNPYQKSIIPFIEKYPVFYNFLKHLSVNGAATIASAEAVLQATTGNSNFIEIKKIIDQWNQRRWIREKDTSERQSGVSVLGTVSETLLEIALASFIDDVNFFKNNKSEVQSYGDFVLMCLPNNLWISVKSNFARERLLASGFTTDIIGAGFFTDDKEFTSGAKIRNFQKVGFLAMYVPDIPISDEQVANNTSTYDAIQAYYKNNNAPLPLNINGTLFIRRLSSLSADLSALLKTADVRKRVTIEF